MELFILGYRPDGGSTIVDYKMKVGETKENSFIGKEELLLILKVKIDENKDSIIFDPETVGIEGRASEWKG